MSTDLVRPDDIEAADSEDLVAALLLRNEERIDERNDKRFRKQWASSRRDEIRNDYEARARAAYAKLWDRCESSGAGHDQRNQDAGGYTVLVCETCGHVGHRGKQAGTNGADTAYDNIVEQAHHMNEEMIRSLRDAMIEVDEKAGILVWPTADDYQPSTNGSRPNGKGRLSWRRGK